jgi:CMP-N-acetylneuraminic acid synthetase
LSESKFIGLVPARSGSKGLRNKNILRLGSNSLLEIAIRSGLDSSSLSELAVSSDSQEYLDIARAVDSKIIAVERSNSAAKDESTADDVVWDFLQSYSGVKLIDFIVYLQPTSPFRTARHVREAVQKIKDSNKTSLVSVAKSSLHPHKAIGVSGDRITQFENGVLGQGSNRQTLINSYHPNGGIYIFQIGTFVSEGKIPVIGSIAYEMNKLDSIDVDSEEDFLIAKSLWGMNA